MSDNIKDQTSPTDEPHAAVHVHNQVRCYLPNHTFTVNPSGTLLLPALDLIPGRRCICGYLVIIDHPGPPLHANAMLAVPIDSAEATKFAHDHPELKKW